MASTGLFCWSNFFINCWGVWNWMAKASLDRRPSGTLWLQPMERGCENRKRTQRPTCSQKEVKRLSSPRKGRLHTSPCRQSEAPIHQEWTRSPTHIQRPPQWHTAPAYWGTHGKTQQRSPARHIRIYPPSLVLSIRDASVPFSRNPFQGCAPLALDRSCSWLLSDGAFCAHLY